MTNGSTLLRRYIDLMERLDIPVLVQVTAYVGIDQQPGASTVIPASMTLEIDSALDRDAMTAAIKAQIQAMTGYEPARFTWRAA